MKTRTAEFTIEGKDTKVKIGFPDDFAGSIGKDRANVLLEGFAIAHWVQTAVKSAFKQVSEPNEKARASTAAKAAELVRKVNAGETLTALNFVPAPMGLSKTTVMIREKWNTASPEKRLPFLKTRGLSESLINATAEEVEAAWNEPKSADEADLG